MKKLLALVLALVMSMSLVTISNAAFKDADKIDYKEAVDVMNAVGVFIGDEKGNFNAKENLTREQAAKIIAYLELGSKAADALPGGATFTDVASTRWSAGFVGYCAQAGVVNGVGNSKFDPAGQLTALQFGKMLLVELGYDAKAAGMVGTDWAINTSKLMAKAKLMDKIDGSVNQVLTREKAAQMTLNALKAPTVEYTTKGSSISVNGAEINLGASEPTYVTNTIAKQQTISDATLTNNGGYTIELGEKLYTKLKLSSGAMDDFGRPIHIWTNDTKKIGEYAEDEDAKYTDSVKLGTIYSDLGLSKGIDDSKVTYYVNGATGSWTDDIVKGSKVEKGGNGTLLEVYYNDDAESLTVVQVNTYVGEIAASFKATTTKDAYVNFNAKTGSGSTYETDDSYSKDDIVLYTYSNKAGDRGVQSMALAEKVTGKMNGYTTEKNVTIDGTTYKKSANGASIANMSNDVGKDVTVYLDKYGYAAYVDASTSAEYAVLLNYAPAARLESARAKLLFTDGTTKKVDVKELIDGSNNTYVENFTSGDNAIGKYDIVSYTINSDDEYTLTLKGDAEKVTEGAERITNGSPVMKLMPSNNYNVSDSGQLIANGKTIFLIADETGTTTTYSVYTGIANVPTVTLAGGTYDTPAAVVSENGTVAKVVFVAKLNSKVSINDQNKDVTLIKGSSAGQSYTKDLGYYYEYDAIINGVEGKIKTESAVANYTLVSGIAYNTKGIATGWNDYAELNRSTNTIVHNGTNVKTGVGTIAEENEVIGLNGTYYAYEDDCKVYYINTNGELTAGSAASITDDVNDQVWFKLTDGVVSTLYIKIVDETSVVTPATSGELTLNSVEYGTGQYTVKYQSTVALETADTYTVSIAKNGITIKSTDGHISSSVAADTETSVDLTYNASSPAGTYTVTLTIKDDSANKTYSVVKTMVIG